jgi:hypothetical protein
LTTTLTVAEERSEEENVIISRHFE